VVVVGRATVAGWGACRGRQGSLACWCREPLTPPAPVLADRRRAHMRARRESSPRNAPFEGPPPKSGILTISSAATDRTPDLEWDVLSERGMCDAGSGTNVTARGLGDGAPARTMRALCFIPSAPRRASKTCRYRGAGSRTILVRIVTTEVCPTHLHAAEDAAGRHLELRQEGGSEPSRRPCASEAA
jgi:hypothetical protein